jgi:hypothetical protein
VTAEDPTSAGYGKRRVTVARAVKADPETVFEFVSDTRNDPLWCPNVTGAGQVEGDGVQVGSTFRFHQEVELGGRTLKSDGDVEILELGERSIRWRVEDRFQIRDVLLVVEPHGDGCRVTQTTTAAFKRRPGIAQWLYPRLAKRTLRDQFDHLAEHFS